MTRVLIIESAGNLWGSERALLDLIASAGGMHVTVCCPPHTPLHRELKRRDVSVLPYFIDRLHERSRWRRAQAAWGVVRACLKFRPDVIHLNQSGAYKVASVAAGLFNIPVVAHVRIFEDAEYLASVRPQPDRLQSMIAISDAMAAELAKFPQLARIPVHRLYDAYASNPGGADVEKVRNRIVCAGRITAIKGQDVLVAAMALLPDIECLMIGAGDDAYMNGLKVKAAKTGSAVKWLGFRQDVASLLALAPVMVCPSNREPLGRVIFEAWDAGAVPVVYGGSGGAAEVVAAAQGGVIYDAQTPDALAKAIKAALALDGKDRADCVARGRRWVATNCSPQGYGQAVEAVLVQAATRRAERKSL